MSNTDTSIDLRKTPNRVSIEVDVHQFANFRTLYDQIKGSLGWPGFYDTDLEMEDYEVQEAFEDAITALNRSFRDALINELQKNSQMETN